MEQLTEKSALLIQLMFSEPAVKEALIDTAESNLYSKVTVDLKTCEVVLGKTRFGWWNRLIGAEKRIALETFAFKLIGILSQKAEGDGKTSIIRQGLAEDVIDSLSRQGRSNEIIDRLYLVGYVGVKTAWSTYSLALATSSEPQESRLNLNINKKTHRFVLPGSGDPIFEVDFGPVGVRMIND